MMIRSALIGSTAIAVLFSGVAAFADVTPEDVWENWKAAAEQGGTGITAASEERDGDTLVITGISMASTADPAVSTEGLIEEMRLKDLGDGTVEITMSDSYSLAVTTPAIEGIEPPVAQTVAISISAPGAVTIASGSPQAVAYDFDLPTVEATMATNADGADPFNFTLSAVNVSGSYLVEGTDLLTSTGDFAFESLSLAAKGKDVDAGQDVEMTAAIGDVAGSFDATLLDPAMMEDMAAALEAGFSFAFDTSYGATSFTLNVVEAGSPTSISGGLDGGSINVAMDSEAFVYETGSKGLNLTVSSADIPFPEVKLALAEGGFGLSMPTTPTEEPAEFSFLAKLVVDRGRGKRDPQAASPLRPMRENSREDAR